MSATGSTEYDTGFGTTPGMWRLLSELLEGARLPGPLNNAIYALRAGEARVVANAYTPPPTANSPKNVEPPTSTRP